MPARPALRAPLAAALAALGAGCALGTSTAGFSPDAPVRAAQGVPARFEVVAPASRVQPADTTAGTGCQSPIEDPRDGTRLRFARSGQTLADYEVPNGRYGVGPGELLRVECNTGRVVGIVRR